LVWRELFPMAAFLFRFPEILQELERPVSAPKISSLLTNLYIFGERHIFLWHYAKAFNGILMSVLRNS
jgi:hypothetical protein